MSEWTIIAPPIITPSWFDLHTLEVQRDNGDFELLDTEKTNSLYQTKW